MGALADDLSQAMACGPRQQVPIDVTWLDDPAIGTELRDRISDQVAHVEHPRRSLRVWPSASRLEGARPGVTAVPTLDGALVCPVHRLDFVGGTQRAGDPH